MNNSFIALKDCHINDKAVKSIENCCSKSDCLERIFISN